MKFLNHFLPILLLLFSFQNAALGATPPFSFTDMDGNVISSENTKGKVVVLNFWYIGCGPCRAEMPALNDVYASFRNDTNVVFAAVTFDPRANVQSFLSKKAFHWPIVTDAEADIKQFRIRSYPKSIIIDREGKIILKTGSHEKIDELLRLNIQNAIDNQGYQNVKETESSEEENNKTSENDAKEIDNNQPRLYGLKVIQRKKTFLRTKDMELSNNPGSAFPTLLYYWSPSCDSCQTLIPELNSLQQNYADSVNFWALFRKHENRKKLTESVEANNFTKWAHLLDGYHDINTKKIYPLTVLYDPIANKVLFQKSGMLNSEDFQTLEAILRDISSAETKSNN